MNVRVPRKNKLEKQVGWIRGKNRLRHCRVASAAFRLNQTQPDKFIFVVACLAGVADSLPVVTPEKNSWRNRTSKKQNFGMSCSWSRLCCAQLQLQYHQHRTQHHLHAPTATQCIWNLIELWVGIGQHEKCLSWEQSRSRVGKGGQSLECEGEAC